MFRRLCVAGVVALCLVPGLLAGCAKKKLLSVGNLPPETTLFVQGDLDTVSHTIHIYWFGSDPDGDVLGFEYRILSPSFPGETGWSFTTRTDSVFAIPSVEDYSESTFEIRAIDDSPTPRPPDAAPGSPAGLRDATPDIASFKVTNVAPTVKFQNRFFVGDETFPAVTLTWKGEDEDGDASTMLYQLGLDTIPSALRTVSGTSATIDTAQFKELGVYRPTGPRTAYIRAIDDGRRASAWDTMTWIVRSPSSLGQRPRLLLIDDVPTAAGIPGAFDSLYFGAARRNLTPGSYAVLRLAPHQFSTRSVPFRTSEDVAQTFMLFDAVVWYRGREGLPSGAGAPNPSPILRAYQDGLAAYLDRGRKLMIESLYLIEGKPSLVGNGWQGALRSDWVTRYLGSTDMILRGAPTTVDSTVDWGIRSGTRLNSSVYDMTLQSGVINGGLRGFVVRDTNHVLAWARQNELSPPVARDIPVAVSVPVPESPAGAGRIIVLTFALAGANVLLNSSLFIDQVFKTMGLDDLAPAPELTSQVDPGP